MNEATLVNALLRIPTEQVEPGPNARGNLGDVSELAASLSALGQQVPLIVERVGERRYRLLDGHRRHAAAKLARLPFVDAVLRRAPGDAERIVRQLAIQSHGRAFNPMAEARALHALMFEHNMPREEIAQAVGRPPGWVRDRIALVHLEAGERRDVEAGRMSLAEALLRLKNRREMREGRPATQPKAAARVSEATPPVAAKPHCSTCTCGVSP